MGRFSMKIGVLTSSRADYGIYLPLLHKMKNDSFFQLEIIAFGTHLSKFHGYTVNDIERDSYQVIHKVATIISNDDEQAISTSYGLTALKFADLWANNSYDLVLCLGDRFEMSAAVQAGIPFRVKFAHIHGGETTLGAIDNTYRHQITLASTLHFASTDSYKEKIISLIDSEENVYSVGALSLDELQSYKPIDRTTFYKKFDLTNKDYVLVTFHPETLAVNENESYAAQMKLALAEVSKELNVVITMPNADTLGSVYRKEIEELKNENPNQIWLIENFGKINYFSAMYYSKFLIGNTSSGILEAASFGKYVINVGGRQAGRIQSDNVVDVSFDVKAITSAFDKIKKLGDYKGDNVYFKSDSSDSIINIVKNSYEKF